MNPPSGSLDLKDRLAVALLSTLIVAICFGYYRGIELTNAWNGWSTVGFTWALESASMMDGRDFYHYVFDKEHLLNSISNWVYPLLLNTLSITPEKTQIAYIIVTTFLYAFSISYLTGTILPNKAFYARVIAISMALFTAIINCNFGSFGQANLSLAQAYSIAIPLQLILMSLSFCKRYILTGFLFALLSCVHISLSLITFPVVFLMYVVQSSKIKCVKPIIGLTIYVLGTALWYFFVIHSSAVVQMPTHEWVMWQRMMNYHFFPFDMQLFTSLHNQSLTPFLGLMLLAFSNPSLSLLTNDVRKMWLAGLFASSVLTAIGLIISLSPPTASLAMLSLHRSSGITLLLLLPVAASHIVILLRKNEYWAPILAFACIVPPFLNQTWGIPVVPALVITVISLFSNDGNLKCWNRKLLAAICLIAVGYEIYLSLFHNIKLSDSAILGNGYLLIVLCMLLFIKFYIVNYRLDQVTTRFVCYDVSTLASKFIIGAVSLVFVLLISKSAYINWQSHPKVQIDIARSYLEAQLWARNSTDPKAVFMPDPAVPVYGRAWSEYSRRSSFGSAREWLHVPLVYHADLKGFQEGVRRLSLLGIDPYPYRSAALNVANKKPSSEFSKLLQDARNAYYSMPAKRLVDLAKKEGIDYFVFLKIDSRQHPTLRVVYENKHVVICKPSVI